MIFSVRKKELWVAVLVLTGLALIGIGLTHRDLRHDAIPIVLGGALITVSAYVMTIDPGKYWRRRRARRARLSRG
jgi:hypothetical protein